MWNSFVLLFIDYITLIIIIFIRAIERLKLWEIILNLRKVFPSQPYLYLKSINTVGLVDTPIQNMTLIFTSESLISYLKASIVVINAIEHISKFWYKNRKLCNFIDRKLSHFNIITDSELTAWVLPPIIYMKLLNYIFGQNYYISAIFKVIFEVIVWISSRN